MATRRFDEQDRAEPAAAALGELEPPALLQPSGFFRKRGDEEIDGGVMGGPYRLREALGDSVYGRAYRAVHARLDREVAVHFFSAAMLAERSFTAEIALAVTQCAQLTHPNVVGVHAMGQGDHGRDLYYVVTDPFEGVPLSSYQRFRQRLRPEHALAIVRQVGRAVRSAHKLGIVHGDLQPALVLIVPVQDHELARVVGFGRPPLSNMRGEPLTHTRRLGVAGYAAPELLRGEPVDVRSDVFGIGALLFGLIAGRPPFVGKDAREVAEQHARGPAPRLTSLLGDEVAADLDELVARCLSYRPEERFPDVVSLMAALRHVSVGEHASFELTDSFPAMPGSNSILPSVTTPATDVTGGRAALSGETTGWYSWGTIWMALALLLFGGLCADLWLDRTHQAPAVQHHGRRLP